MEQTRLQTVADQLQRLKDNDHIALSLKLVQAAIVCGVIWFLTSKLESVGWEKVLSSLPSTPWFYIFFGITYLAYPVAEQRVYRLIWQLDERLGFSVFLRMRIYNLAILSYSGEAFLALWARKNLPLRNRRILATIKDSNILSALASNSFTIILLATLLATDQLHFITDADADFRYYLALAALVGIILVPAVIHFRRHLLSIEGPLAKQVFLTHLTRQIIVLVGQVAMWSVAVPEVSADTWLLLLTAQMVLTRVPFLPNTDLLLAGLGITLMGYMAAPEAKLAGMFFAAGILGQVCNLAGFVFASLPAPRARRTATENAS